MPLADLSLVAALKFTLEKTVTGWPSIVQGEDSVTVSLAGVDLEEWTQAYAAKLSLAGAATTTVDLASFTNLAGEAVTLNRVFGIVVQVVPTVAANADCDLVVEPGAANGLVWNMAAVTVLANQTYLMTEAADNATGTAVDATHKTLKFTNSGADALTATVVILGGTA